MNEPKADVKFVEPPPLGNGRYDWVAIGNKLRKKPGEWALIFEGDRSSVVVALRSGNVSTLTPAMGFEFRTINNDKTPPRTCDLLMRYVPEKDETAAPKKKGK